MIAWTILEGFVICVIDIGISVITLGVFVRLGIFVKYSK
jgi:hypothetical protein